MTECDSHFNELEEDLRTDSITAQEIDSAAIESYTEYYNGYRQQLADDANIDIGDSSTVSEFSSANFENLGQIDYQPNLLEPRKPLSLQCQTYRGSNQGPFHAGTLS